MEFLDLAVRRRSIRNFQERTVPRGHLDQILEAARLAPSGTNRQPWRFVLLTGEERERVSEAVIQPFVTAAPALFVCCLDRNAFTRGLVDKRMAELADAGVVSREVSLLYGHGMPEKVEDVVTPASAYLDLGIAVEHMALQAAELGLGSCWVRMFNQARLHEILGLPPEIEVVVLLPVGYPAEEPAPRPRLPMEQITLQPSWQ